MLQKRLRSRCQAGILALAFLIGPLLPLEAASVIDPPSKKNAFKEFFAALGQKPAEHEKPTVCDLLLKATEIAEKNAYDHTRRRCWRYVKRALVQAEVVESYPGTVNAKDAGWELTEHHNFVQLTDITRPEDAPLGSVLVYGGRGAGHVEFRTEEGYVSDFHSTRPSSRPLIGVFVKAPEVKAGSTDK